MWRAVVLALGLTSCAFAQKHPAITAGLVSGTIGTVTCLPAVEKQTTCLWIGAVAGLAIGGITGLVTTFADTSAHGLPALEEEEKPIVRRKKAAPQPAASPGTAPSPASPSPASPASPASPPPANPTPASPASPSPASPASPSPASPASPSPASATPLSPTPAPSSVPPDAGVPAHDAGAAPAAP